MLFENFVMYYDNFFTVEECNTAISSFNKFDSLGFTYSRNHRTTRNHHIDDKQLFSNTVAESASIDIQEFNIASYFLNKFWETAYKEYTSKYSILIDFPNHTVRSLKIQKTNIGEGYHVWHCEDSSFYASRRVLTFTLYLNDVDEGGETEFLYYPKRIKSTVGKLVMFPAGFTHTHRGNPPISNEKYILTGWMELTE